MKEKWLKDLRRSDEKQIRDLLIRVVSEDNDETLKEDLESFHASEIADVFEYLNTHDRRRILRAVDLDTASEIFSFLEEFDPYIHEIGDREAADILENMDIGDAIDVLQELEPQKRAQIAALLSDDTRTDIREICSYDEEEIGRRMTTNYVCIPRTFSVKQAMRSLIAQASENDNISNIYVEDGQGKFYGVIELKDLIIARAGTDLEQLIQTSCPFVFADEQIGECIEDLKKYEEDTIPVLNRSFEMEGVITPYDIIEASEEEMSEDYAKFAGLTEEEELDESVFHSLRKRLPWLTILLFLGTCVTVVVGFFEKVVAEITLIVCFQSLILGMSGNVGTQSLAVTIRTIAEESLDRMDRLRLIFKELTIGLLNGVILGGVSCLVLGIFVWQVKHYPAAEAFAISGCAGAALLIAMFISGFVGTMVPLFFHRIRIDPAVASGPFITTINDLIGVVVYYGLAWIFLINLLGM